MAKKSEPTSVSAVPPKSAASHTEPAPRKTVSRSPAKDDDNPPVADRVIFTQANWYMFFGGVALMVLGFVLMAAETAEYGFGPLGLTIGPILLALSFAVQFFAIMYRKRQRS